MDRNFLETICEAYLIQNGVYKEHPKDAPKMLSNIVKDVTTMITELRNTDIELYDMLWDRGKLTQQQIIKQYLDYRYLKEDEGTPEVINEIALTTSILIAMAVSLYSTRVNKTLMGILSKIGSGFESVGKFLTTKGRFFQFRYAIVQKNAEICYKNCGITPEDAGVFVYTSVGKESPVFTNEKASKKAKCLRDCYITQAIESLDLLMKAYFICLRNAGEFGKVQELNPDDLLKTISGLKLSSVCNEYYQEIKNAFDRFYDLLDFAFEDDERKKQEIISQLKEKLIKSRKDVTFQKSFDGPRQNSQSFQRPSGDGQRTQQSFSKSGDGQRTQQSFPRK